MYKIMIKNKKRRAINAVVSMFINGRGDRIRTYDPLRPRQVRYQTALRPDDFIIIT